MGKNHKGYSLIEVIVVLAIMVIVTVGAGALLYNWKSWNFNDCIKKVDTGLASAKVDCMNKESGSLKIYWDDLKENYYMKVSDEEEEALGDDKMEIFYSDTDGSTDVKITGSTELILSYDRGTGQFNAIKTNASGNPVYCNEIKIKRANRVAYVKLVKSTGKHYIEE